MKNQMATSVGIKAAEPLQRRTTVRLEVGRLPAQLWTYGQFGCESQLVSLINLSAGGGLIEYLGHDLILGQAIRLMFGLTAGPWFSGDAAIIRISHPYHQTHSPNLVGIRFAIDANKHRTLSQWIAEETARRHRAWLDNLHRSSTQTML